MKQRAHDLLRVLTNASRADGAQAGAAEGGARRSGDRDKKRIYGDLIHANLHAIGRGASEAELVNYYDPECRTVKVPLDPSLSAAQNAQKYYKEYRKAQTAEQILAQQIAEGEEELRYIDTVFDALSPRRQRPGGGGTAEEHDCP